MKVFGLAGWSGAGKTTLIEKLIPLFVADGLRVTLIKQTHHDVDIDQPGKDSWRARQAGAHEVLLASGQRWALMHELRGDTESDLQGLLTRLAPVDLVLVEGYKREAIPKMEVHRRANKQPWLYPDDTDILAVASDIAPPGEMYWLDLNDTAAIYRFIRNKMGV
ncbi:MAG: molybdopterin-guanine dinucleotide biosynthesis protein B [Pseudomonadota bacterium]